MLVATTARVTTWPVDGIQGPEGFQHAPSRAIVKKAVARLEVPFWRRPPMLSRSTIEEGGKWRERRGGTEWKPPPAPKQSKRKPMKKKRNADLRSSSREEAVQQQQRQLEDQKQQQQLKEQEPDKGQKRDSTDGAAAGEVKETDSSNQPRRMTAEICTPSTTSLGASSSFFGSGYSTIANKASEKETPATTAGDPPASSKKSSVSSPPVSARAWCRDPAETATAVVAQRFIFNAALVPIRLLSGREDSFVLFPPRKKRIKWQGFCS